MQDGKGVDQLKVRHVALLQQAMHDEKLLGREKGAIIDDNPILSHSLIFQSAQQHGGGDKAAVQLSDLTGAVLVGQQPPPHGEPHAAAHVIVVSADAAVLVANEEDALRHVVVTLEQLLHGSPTDVHPVQLPVGVQELVHGAVLVQVHLRQHQAQLTSVQLVAAAVQRLATQRLGRAPVPLRHVQLRVQKQLTYPARAHLAEDAVEDDLVESD